MPDWKKTEDYRFSESLGREQWAWEFLRRNPDYRREWREFRDTWAALEADYGKAPHRDFQRWKLDPRAYVLEGDEGVCADSESCKVDGDKILIECHLGARWGFYKFPLDPATDVPEIGKDLLWRDVAREVVQVAQGDETWLGSEQSKIALGFDLALPLKEQLEVAKRYLIAVQHWMRREEGITMRTIVSLQERLTLCLRLLDALEQGATQSEMARTLFPAAGENVVEEELAELEREARELVAGGYRQLLLIPE